MDQVFYGIVIVTASSLLILIGLGLIIGSTATEVFVERINKNIIKVTSTGEDNVPILIRRKELLTYKPEYFEMITKGICPYCEELSDKVFFKENLNKTAYKELICLECGATIKVLFSDGKGIAQIKTEGKIYEQKQEEVNS